MGLDQNVRVRLERELDYDKHSKLTAIADRAMAIDAPILIVGLGGTGVGAALKVKKMVYDRLRREPNTDKPKNIEYLAIDTAEETKKMNIGGVGFSEAEHEIFILTTPNFQALLKSPTLTANVKSWVNADIPLEAVINGAGAVRQAGRFMLFHNLHEVETAISDKIKLATAPYPANTPLYVFILAGISGGTGSGTFIDIAYLTKALGRKYGNGRTINNVGIIFLPDVNVNIAGMNDAKKAGLKANGFAALKELDYLMNLSNTGDSFKQDYETVKVGPENDGSLPPFNTCILMSSKDQKGVTLTNPYDYTLSVAAETVLNFIAGEAAASVDNFSINAVLSNDHDNQINMMSLIGNEVAPANYCYTVAGASNMVLPMDDIISYMTYLAFREVEGMWNRVPSFDDVNMLMMQMGLTLDILANRLIFSSQSQVNLNRHTYENIRQAPQLIIQDFDIDIKQREDYVNAVAREIIDGFTRLIESEQNPIHDMFIDIARGPVYAQHAIYTDSDNYCVSKAIREIKNRAMMNKPGQERINAQRYQTEQAMQELLDSNAIFAGGKERARKNYIEALSAYYGMQYEEYAGNVLMNVCDQLESIIMDYNNKIYNNVAEMMDVLMNLFRKYAGIKSETIEEQKGNTTTLTWSMVKVPKFLNHLVQRISNMNDELYTDLHMFVRQFYQFLFENADLWGGKRLENIDVVDEINDFISNSFRNILSQSMDYYVDFIARCENKTVDEYITELLKGLVDRARYKFPTKADFSTANCPQPFSYISVPANSKFLISSAKSKVSGHSAIKESGLYDRVFMANFGFGMPLYAYGDFAQCYDTYIELKKDKTGLHLYETPDVNWGNLPTPEPPMLWDSGRYYDADSKEAKYWNEIFDKALENGIIQYKSEGGAEYYLCRWGEKINVKGILDARSLNLSAEQLDTNEAVLALNEIKAKVADADSRLNQSKRLYKNRHKQLDDGSSVIDVEFAKAIFAKMVTVRTKVAEMVADVEAANEALDKLSVYGDKDAVIPKFIKLFYTETITKRRGQYVYTDKEGALQTFTALEGIQNNYPHYYLFSYFFEKYSAGDKVCRKDLMYVCDNLYKEKQKTDEDFDAMRTYLEGYVAELKEIIAKLNQDWADVANGETILAGYRKLLQAAEGELSGLSD